MKFRGIACVSVLAMVFALATGALAVEKGFLWDGNHWKDMSHDLKVAYVWGIGNMADFETAAAGSTPPPCISKGFVDELKAKTIVQVIAAVDNYYQENAGKMDMPVIAVIMQRCTKLCPAPEAGKR
jgi:hypothetical protein